jgi:hypothetical protein
MLHNLRPSPNALAEPKRLHDPCYIVRLVGAAATLFRMGKAHESRQIGQFTVDIAGYETWDKELKERMEAEVQPNEAEYVSGILDDAVHMIRLEDALVAARLEGMLSVMR